jgi:hypothetical protein
VDDHDPGKNKRPHSEKNESRKGCGRGSSIMPEFNPRTTKKKKKKKKVK